MALAVLDDDRSVQAVGDAYGCSWNTCINGSTQTFPPAIPEAQRRILTDLGVKPKSGRNPIRNRSDRHISSPRKIEASLDPLLVFGPNCGKDGWVAEIGVTVRQFAAELFVEHFDLPPLRIEHRSVMIFAVLIMRSVRKTWRAAGIWVTAVDGPTVVKAALPALQDHRHHLHVAPFGA